jgi:hypothetical protein
VAREQGQDRAADGGKRAQPLALTRCRACGSRLLQVDRVWLIHDGRHVVDRRCPDCERRDSVAVEPRVLAVWLRRERRLRADLRALVAPRAVASDRP